MATKRLSDGSSVKDSFKLSRGAASVAKPEAPTIGAATQTGSTTATVAYTAATLGALATTFTATSNPSSITGTGASPITVSGLSGSTNYTFTVTASNANGSSTASAASNSITTATAATRGVVAGGYPGSGTNNDVGAKLSSIEYINIVSLSNYTSFGNLAVAKSAAGNVSSSTRGLFFDNVTSPQIEYITIATTGNGTTFGSMSIAAYGCADGGGWSNATRGAVFGGYTNPGNEVTSNVIQYVTIASTGNTTTFGTLILARYSMCGTSSTTRGIMTSGNYNFSGGSGPSSEIEYVTIASTGNATSFGDMVTDRDGSTAASSNTRGLIATGYLDGTNLTDAIDYITIASTGNGTNFGSMSSGRRTQSGMSNSTRAVFTVGNIGQGPYYRVPTGSDEYVTIATTGNSANFGELITKRVANAGTASDSHGGL